MKKVLVSALLATSLVGCDTSTPVVPTQPKPSATVPDEGGVKDPGVFVSKRYGMKLRLPNSSGWKINDSKSRWLVASNEGEGSNLLVRLWRGENRMTRDKCEEIARGFRKLPVREGAEIVSEQLVDVPPGFDTRADVGLMTDSKGGLYGFILGFGGLGRKCFAYVYVTRAEGPGADTVVANRLAETMEGSLAKITFDSDLEAVLERDAEAPGADPEPPP
jgi:hypothetical protein